MSAGPSSLVERVSGPLPSGLAEAAGGAASRLGGAVAPVASSLSAVTERAGRRLARRQVSQARREERAVERLRAGERQLARWVRRQERHARRSPTGGRAERRSRRLASGRRRAERSLTRYQARLSALGGGGAGRLIRRRRAAGRPGRGEPMGIDLILGEIRTGHFERMMSALTAVGAAVTAVEIWSEHDGASFGNKMMWLPVVIVPTAVPLGIASVFSRRVAKTVLPAFSALIVANGLQGMYFHWRGIVQKPGGLRQNARYNLEMGPPAFAPLLASIVGGMGLLAAVLRREDEDG